MHEGKGRGVLSECWRNASCARNVHLKGSRSTSLGCVGGMSGPRECVTLKGPTGQEGWERRRGGCQAGHSPCKGLEGGSKPSKEALGPKERRRNGE